MSIDGIPAAWCTALLGDICTKPQYGYTTKASDAGEVQFLRTTDITKGPIDWGAVPYCFEPPADVLKYQLHHGDIVISRAGSIGFSSLIEDPPVKAVFASYLIRFNPILMDANYVKRFLESGSYWSQLAASAAGNALQNVNAKKLQNIETLVPPIAEQKLIVVKLDELLAQVNTTKARLDAIPAILKRFRQSILAAAVSGRLTEDWRTHNGVDFSEWSETDFSKISDLITVGYVGKMSDQYQDHGVPFLRSQNVREFRYSPDNLLFISEEFHKKISKSSLRPGDLAVVRSGAPGTTCVIPNSLPIANCSDLVIVRPGPSLNPYFGAIFMNSEAGKAHVGSNRVGVAQQHFNVGSMKKMGIRLPTSAEQTEIVRRVDQLFAFADQIERSVQAAQARVNQLTQSILAQAFRGELTAEWRVQHPELITGENSAEALLTRIREERANAPRTRRGRRKASA
ncbi:restriction endonuclease subunit S [Guyparkeria sp. SCN-R1]|uniref:restriction endonuclease subunit S n=1 Tax=Guyparkeria sp. SCN-R1 TaxID=2341113 RepID=UPI000F653BD9|nr:restriction endonuclease subunit S [Guyparkeria sp. SCN-R1]RRQ20345.1 restriction endonuclease subunit S [Guyparkeria sp. SCN-R1]